MSTRVDLLWGGLWGDLVMGSEWELLAGLRLLSWSQRIVWEKGFLGSPCSSKVARVCKVSEQGFYSSGACSGFRDEDRESRSKCSPVVTG